MLHIYCAVLEETNCLQLLHRRSNHGGHGDLREGYNVNNHSIITIIIVYYIH